MREPWVVFAMLASYVLSRTLVPTLVMLMMKRHAERAQERPNLLLRLYLRFDRGFERLRGGYIAVLSALLTRRKVFVTLFLGFCAASCALFLVLGEDFFPRVDAGQIKLHMRAPTGTRIEETARLSDHVDAAVRRVIPARDLEAVLHNLGVPNSGINLSYSNSGTIGTLDGEFQISLKPGHAPSEGYIERLRAELPRQFPGVEFFFQPADIVTQILNFGLPAAIDVQVAGNNIEANHALASRLMKRIMAVPGTVDTHIHQRLDQPTLALQMDRTALQQLNLNAVNVAQNALVSLAGSFQTAPNFWLNPTTGVVYSVAVQTPQYRIDSLDALMRTPIGQGAEVQPQLLGNLVQLRPAAQLAVSSRYDIAPVIDIYVSVAGRGLGGVADDIRQIVDDMKPQLARGSRVTMRGQVRTMQSSFIGLGIGLAMAIVLVYLLIVVNFQSWIDPLIIISALPAALAGIAWMLLLTDTRLSVPALTGAIMTMGVATANSILVVSFARQRLDERLPPLSAALEAGATRIRPVLMTALAMIIGMLPMALSLGEGGEQNAPLGRAVIGGLLLATFATLFFVPVVFAAVHRRLARRAAGRALPDAHPT